ncbi:hypothetical protein DF3PB_1020005 [uncultured Defluviicoccus sp.]|nr:hypothetical protein DF3PB_1020005 [uncultured Defluviicoccus sp.]
MEFGSFCCGPVAVDLAAPSAALYDKVAETLNLYTVVWKSIGRRVKISVVWSDQPAPMLTGNYLTCGRMHVDRSESGLSATCRSGASVVSDAERINWTLSVPQQSHSGETVPEDVEDLVGLVLVAAWRDLNKVALHAGSISRNGTCALLCATSGGGKTTLTASLIRRGWQTLGDDKLLLVIDGQGVSRLSALIHNFNLHPRTETWFPEIGDISRLPRYSAWTEKRKVRIEAIWPGAAAFEGVPTHVLAIERSSAISDIRVAPMPKEEVLPTLLRQTVVPKDRNQAAQILKVLAATASTVKGLKVTVGQEVYRHPDRLEALEEVLH